MRRLPSVFSLPSLSRRGWMCTTASLVALGMFPAFGGDKAKKDDETDHKEPKTIGDIVSVAGLTPFPVEGVGLVVGLDGTGSDPVQGEDRNRLLAEMQKRGVRGSEEILRSGNVAMVKVRAKIPPAVRSCKTAGCWCREKGAKQTDDDLLRPHKGDTFDVEIESPTRDGTKSLKGGWLLPTFLWETADLPGAGNMPGRVHAKASGPVLIMGGLDHQEPNPADLKRGRVLGGGIATEDRGFALITDTERTARWTIQIASRINDRFSAKTRDGKPIAEPKDGQRVLLRIPTAYHENMARYLEVLRYITLSRDVSQETDRVERYSEELLDPAKARIAALRLEGIGHRAAEPLMQALTSSDPDVRFFAAESLAYMNDPKAADVLAQTAREIPEYRAHALTALSAIDEPIAPLKLHELTNDSNSVELRYGAFRALRSIDSNDTSVAGEPVGNELFLHQISTTGAPFIHVSSRDRAEIVLFGTDLKLQTPLVLSIGNKITVKVVRSQDGKEFIQMRRLALGETDRRVTCNLNLNEVIHKAVALGATYPDIVGMLVQADNQHNLPGRLELDAIPDPTRFVARLQQISNSAAKTPENVSMPNLFHWTDSRKSVRGNSDDTDEIASSDSTSDRKDSKPSWFGRLIHRSGN